MSRLERLLRVVRPRAGDTVTLDARRIYILPTGFGGLYLGALVLMLIAAANYANNAVFLLVFLLAGAALNDLFACWRNLYRLEITLEPVAPVFAGRCARVRFRLGGGARPGLRLVFADTDRLLDMETEGTVFEAPLTTRRRGLLPLPRLRIETRHPLGLFRAWSIIEPRHAVLVHPRPRHDRPPRRREGREGGGPEEWIGLRRYRPGDPPARIDWKGVARGHEPRIQQFATPREEVVARIDWDAHAPADTEIRLSRMTAEVLEAARRGGSWTLHLPGRTLGPARGATHRAACLRALALFGLPEDSSDAAR